MCGRCLGEKHEVALGEVGDSIEDGRFGAVEAGGAQDMDDSWSQERAMEVVCLARHDCASVDRDLDVDIITSVSWRGVRMSGVLESCSDGNVVCDTNVCASESRRRVWNNMNHVKDGQLCPETLTLFIHMSFAIKHN